MKNPIFVALLSSTLLAIPGLAQQNANASAAQTTTTGQTAPASQRATNDRDLLQPETSTDFWDGDEPNLVNLVTHPFASKKYVQRLTRPIKDRLNELDQITASNHDTIKDIDARSQKGIQLASEKTDLADQHASDARGPIAFEFLRLYAQANFPGIAGDAFRERLHLGMFNGVGKKVRFASRLVRVPFQ